MRALKIFIQDIVVHCLTLKFPSNILDIARAGKDKRPMERSAGNVSQDIVVLDVDKPLNM